MLVKTLLNKVENFKSFVYKAVHLEVVGDRESLVVDIEARKNSKQECSICGKRFSRNDTQPSSI